MLGVMVFIVLGAGIGWFSYRETGWFLEICASLGLVAFAVGRWTVVPMLAVAEDQNTDSVHVYAKLLAKLPDWTMNALLAAFMSLLLTRIALHVKERCYTEPPAPETREQLRARLQAEMNYTDSLL